MAKCIFCGMDIHKGTGKMLIYNSGKIIHFCSRTCEKNMIKLGRKPINVRWTEEYRMERKKGITISKKKRKEAAKKEELPTEIKETDEQ